MSDVLRPPPKLLAERVNHLFETVHPGKAKPFTHAEVAEAINAEAGENVISATYIWQLRTGKRDNPTRKHIAALAKFFGVSPLYFFDVEEEAETAVPVELVTALADDAVRGMALRAVGLSEQSLGAIQSMIDNARRIEGLKLASGES